jgi:MFS family permease
MTSTSTPSDAANSCSDTPSRWPATFAALRYRNYRLWFIGQGISLMGTWMQWVAQGWLVYELTGSELALGIISFFGSLPTLFLMLPAGAIADRVSRRTLLLATQAVMTAQALVLALLAATGALRVWHIAVLAAVLGLANSFDAPARMALTVDMVEDRRDLANAVALNSSLFNMARIVGPAVGGVLLAGLGATWCFALNGLSFLAVLIALWRMSFPPVKTAAPEPMAAQVRAGLHYVVHHEVVRAIIALVTVASLFGLGYSTLIPAYAADVLHVGETGLGTLNAVAGVGALVGSLMVASMGSFARKGRVLVAGSILFPIATILFALSRSFALSTVVLAVLGFAFVIQTAISQTLLQSIVPDALRGRVLSVFSFSFFGTAPFASLFAGSVAQAWGIPAGIGIGGGITLVFSALLLWAVPSLVRVKA